MKNLFVIDGASGSGKSELLRYIEQYSTNAAVVRKYTNREMREYEKEDWFLDLDFVTSETFDDLACDYVYTYSGHKYGFRRPALVEALLRSKNVFVIVRNPELIRRLCAEYEFINVVPMYVYTNPHDIRKRLRSRTQKMTREQVSFRLKRLKIAFEDYLKHPEFYSEVLINQGDPSRYHGLIERIIAKYQYAPDIDDKLVFILMSFNPHYPALEDYANAMKDAVALCDSSYRCINLDDLTGSFKISDEAKRHIQGCRLAIVDLTENKPNVFYELGFAHGIGKKVIITAHEDTPRHFYPGEYKTVTYKSATNLRNKLVKEIRGILGSHDV